MSKKLLSTLLTKVYKMNDEEIAELLKDSDEPESGTADQKLIDTILAKDVSRVNGFTEHATKRFDAGHKKGKAEALSDLEKNIRVEFGVDEDDLQGLDLIRHIVVAQTSKATEGKEKITDDVIKKMPAYLALEQRLKAREKELLKEKEEAINGVHTEYRNKELKHTVRGKAIELLNAMNPVLPADAAKAERLKEMFLTVNVDNGRFELTQDGTILMLDNDNQPIKDAHGYTQTFDNFIKERATSTFDFPQTQQRSTANGQQNSQQKTNQSQQNNNSNKPLPAPKNLEELAQVLEDRTYTIQDRQTIQQQYDQSHAVK